MKQGSISIKSSGYSGLLAFLINIFTVYIVYQICRVAFLIENWASFKIGLSSLNLFEAFKGSLLFDTSAIFYTNALYLLLMLMPFTFRDKRVCSQIAKWYFVIVNSIAISANLIDSVYFVYTNRRTTCSVFSEFDNDPSQEIGRASCRERVFLTV